MLKQALALALAAAPIVAQTPTTYFRDFAFHGYLGVETRFGRPVVTLVGSAEHAITWHPSAQTNVAWGGLGLELRVLDVATIGTQSCTSGAGMILIGQISEQDKYWEGGPFWRGFSYATGFGDWFPGIVDHGHARFIYCNRWEPWNGIFIGPCGGDCWTFPRPGMWGMSFEVRLL